MTQLYDPLSYESLAKNVVSELLSRPLNPLPPEVFQGPGVYAIYYREPLDYVDDLAEVPIYVGKAVPAGTRKGGKARSPVEERPLHRRLREHAKSVGQAEDLILEAARCRHLPVYPVWISLAERFLLTEFQPVWNTLLDGFGNHDPGRGRRASARSRWDTVHPGRPWAARLRTDSTREEIVEEVRLALSARSSGQEVSS